MIRLVTVTGSRTNTLKHMLNHYKSMVDEMYVVVYEWDGFSTYDAVEKIVKEFPTAQIIKRTTKEKFNWEYVTHLYNQTKMLFPNDWWIVSDDDEFQVYSKVISDIIKICDESGYEFVTGGFVDRIGKNGTFAEIKEDSNLWELFPMAGFFRYPLSGACPNKVTMCKGYIEVTPGQHYAKIDGQTTWKWQGWNHPLRFPTTQNFTQVHHFKWDSTVLDRLQDVANVNSEFSYSNEYQTMYDAIKSNNFKIDIYDERFLFEEVKNPSYFYYKNWNKLSKIILSI
jgi:hypothetical protein